MLNKEDRKRFLMALTKTKVSLPGMNFSDEEEAIRVDVFWEELHRYSIEEVEKAFKWARGSLTFFPKPVEITNQIEAEAKEKYLRNQAIEDPEKIEWMPPTEEGKKIALDLLNSLKEKWEKEDMETNTKRIEKFEKNRKNLQKQAKLLVGK